MLVVGQCAVEFGSPCEAVEDQAADPPVAGDIELELAADPSSETIAVSQAAISRRQCQTTHSAAATIAT